jgi:hypothetical protein
LRDVTNLNPTAADQGFVYLSRLKDITFFSTFMLLMNPKSPRAEKSKPFFGQG